MIDSKIKGELVNKLSPVLKYMYLNGMIDIKSSKDEARVDFFNGSSIIVAPALDSSRGQRSNFLVYEECRLLKKGDIDSIFSPMQYPRQPIYLQKDEYSRDKDYLEDAIEIYITSSRYKNEWWYRLFKKTVVECFVNSQVPYNFFNADIYTSLQNSLKTRNEWLKIQKNANPIDVQCEYLNEAIGETEDAYFQLDLLKKCQRLHKAFRPPTSEELLIGTVQPNREKKDNEVRILAIDFAFANTIKNGQANDNTVIECVSGFYDKGEIIRNLDYLETIGGGESELTQRRIRELFYDYQADYIIFDNRSGGEIIYNDLTKPYKHPTRDLDKWDSSGFTVVLDNALHFVGDAKVADLQSRTIDPNAKPVMIPVLATSDFNDLMWRSLRTAMVDNKLRLLIDDIEFDIELAKRKDYHKLTSKEKMLERLPYVQTEFLVNEAINLKQELREGKIKLKEPRSSTKDRIVTLGYANMFFNTLENKMSKADQRDDFDESAWNNIMLI